MDNKYNKQTNNIKMVDITTLRSIGMIETGSHSIQEWEVVRDPETDKLRFISHDDGTEDSLDEVYDMFITKNDPTLFVQLWQIDPLNQH